MDFDMTAGRSLTRDDIMPMSEYEAIRKERRAAITALKRDRRLSVGPYATFYFENFETMWMQVHEMLFIERGGEAQIAGELTAYNPLIPRGKELIATLMLEIADPVQRERALLGLNNIENSIALIVGDTTIAALPIEDEISRTNSDGKTSSVHFVRFPFDDAAVVAFRDPATRTTLGFEHPNYGHLAILPDAIRDALAKDLA